MLVLSVRGCAQHFFSERSHYEVIVLLLSVMFYLCRAVLSSPHDFQLWIVEQSIPMKTTVIRDLELKQESEKAFLVDPETLFEIMKKVEEDLLSFFILLLFPISSRYLADIEQPMVGFLEKNLCFGAHLAFFT